MSSSPSSSGDLLFGTPGGDLGEFILAFDAFLDMDGSATWGRGGEISQNMVDNIYQGYLEFIPQNRPLTHCTDDRAIRHLEGEIGVENLDLYSPPDSAKEEI